MKTFHASSMMPCDARTLYDWHANAGALERLTPPWQRVTIAERHRGADHPRIGNGAIARLMVGLGPLNMPWVAEHFDHDPPHGFSDRQLSGPFGSWMHRHEFSNEGNGLSRLDDRIRYEAPAGFLGSVLLGGKLAADLDRLFWFRHERTRADLARHARTDEKLTIAIAGSSGMIGSALAAFLSTGGHKVIRLVRGRAEPDPIDGIAQRHWDPAASEISPYTLSGVDAVVNLCGENIADGRWTEKRKARLRRSRVQPTSLLAKTMASLPSSERPKVLINASGVHAYGDLGDEPLTEDAGWGDGFLADLVRAWEAAAWPAESVGVRLVFARFGMVLGAGGGALKALMAPTKFGLSGPIGTGRQWWPWIGLDDAIGAVQHAIMDDDLDGPVNVCAPDAATANDVSSAVAEAVRRPAVLGLPAGAARAMLGEEMAGDMLLSSTRAEPARLGEAGFRWMHPTLLDAVGWELGVRRLMERLPSDQGPIGALQEPA